MQALLPLTPACSNLLLVWSPEGTVNWFRGEQHECFDLWRNADGSGSMLIDWERITSASRVVLERFTQWRL